MAKKARAVIDLGCSECKRINYHTTRNIRPESGKLEPLNLKKYCKWCRKHTEHKEIR